MAIRKIRLPSAYQQVEYIESSGTQYIDTQYQTSSTTKVVSKFLIPDDTFANENIFYGQTTYTYNRFCFSYYNTSSTSSYSKGLYFFGSLTSAVVNGDFINQVIESEITKTSIIINGVNYSNSNDTSSSNTLWLFRCGNKYSNNRLYYLKIYDNNVLVRNFIPCYRKSDSVIGLYDTVNGIFYTNAGSGTFTKGNDVMPKVKHIYKGSTKVIKSYKGTNLIFADVPSTFQRVEYIESSGTQYIDTQLPLTNNTGVKLKASFTNNNINRVLLGTLEIGVGRFQPYFNGSTTDLQSAIDLQNTTINIDNINTNVNEFEYNVSNRDIKYNGVSKGTVGSIGATTQTIYLFCRNYSASPLYAEAKIYYCSLYDNGTLVRNFIPCYRKTDNEIGLYDVINGVFYTNAGTGTFTKGANI